MCGGALDRVGRALQWCAVAGTRGMQAACVLPAVAWGREASSAQICMYVYARIRKSLGIIQSAPTRWVLALFLGFMNFWSNAPKFRFVGGGGILFEICEKRPFQKCMGWGGGVR